MKNKERLIYGIGISVGIFLIATQAGIRLNFKTDFIPSSFLTHSIMLILSIGAIYFLRKDVAYRISLPALKKCLKPILLGILTTIIVNIFMSVFIKITGGKIEIHPLLTGMTTLQVFIFVFIYASIAEEFLFRGFLLNILKPISIKGLNIFNRKISIPVIISAIAFGLAHLILITTGVGALFLVRIVIFTTVLGLIAGYYQEKYNNNAYAIIVHMSGNLLVVISTFIMS
jgi:membrane protease YdiL (CAAX protease family)